MDRDDPDPQFGVQACSCAPGHCDMGNPRGCLLFIMLRPLIRPMQGTEELAAVMPFPISHIENFIRELRRLVKEVAVREPSKPN